jgi:hypothetical protein
VFGFVLFFFVIVIVWGAHKLDCQPCKSWLEPDTVRAGGRLIFPRRRRRENIDFSVGRRRQILARRGLKRDIIEFLTTSL